MLILRSLFLMNSQFKKKKEGKKVYGGKIKRTEKQKQAVSYLAMNTAMVWAF